ncbi:M56 family metallopeptidase [Diplocloster hominis]|uniref:M56 family metallopeptidase n=1 Tax=Diplocloster hominis TaxID=3079010 RepID=UPI0031BB41B7
MTLVRMSVSAGIMIALVAAVRLLLLHRLPKKTFLVLWWIVLARLLIPISFPSPVSIYSMIDQKGAHGYAADTTVGNLLPLNHAGKADTGGLSGLGSQADPFSLVTVLGLLWLAGGLLCAMYFLVCYIRCRRVFAEALPLESDAVSKWLMEHDLIRQLVVRQCSRLRAPLSYGILRPVILLPKQKVWDVQELDYILLHEHIHVRRFDGLTKFLLTAALCVHWFNPFVWIMYVIANRDLELSCDEAVLCALGQTSRYPYAMTLISMEEQKGGLVPFANSFSRFAIEERMKAIMKYKKSSFWAALVSIALIIGITIGFATSSSADIKPNPDREIIQTPAGRQNKLPEQSPAASADHHDMAGTEPAGEQQEQAIVFENVELRYYDDGWPYLHNILTNLTDRTVVDTQYCMLAYDESGNPLKLKWFLPDSSSEYTYDWLVEDDTTLKPGQTSDPVGGWSLYDGEKMTGWPKVGDGGPNQVAYGLFCVKQVTFQDGTVWDNPGYNEWLKTYKGKSADVSTLQNYYPYVHPVTR